MSVASTQEQDRRHWQAERRARRAFLRIIDPLPSETLERLATTFEEEAEQTITSSAKQDLVLALTGRTYSEEERIELETRALLQSFRHRQELLRDSLSATQVAELLSTTRQTPHDRAKSGSLLAVLDRGTLRFPIWQFDPQGPDGVIEGLPRVLRALHVPALSKVSWLQRLNPFLASGNGDAGITPLEALKRGEVERVVEIARGIGRT